MKRILTLGLLAVVAVLGSSRSADAWTNYKFSIGLNWACQSGNNNFLWGLWHNGQVPEDGGYGGAAPHGNPLPPGYGPPYPPGTQPFPFFGSQQQQPQQSNMPGAAAAANYNNNYYQAGYQPAYTAPYTTSNYTPSYGQNTTYPGYYYNPGAYGYGYSYGDNFTWYGR